MGFAQTHKGLLERSPLTARTLTKGIYDPLFCCADSDAAVFRATNSGCYEQNPDERDFGAWRSLRYRIEMVQVSWWTDGGMECGALPAACAPVGVRKPSNITQQRCSVVGNDPCVVPFRGKDTFLWGVQIYPPSSVAERDSFPPRGSLLYAVHT